MRNFLFPGYIKGLPRIPRLLAYTFCWMGIVGLVVLLGVFPKALLSDKPLDYFVEHTLVFFIGSALISFRATMKACPPIANAMISHAPPEKGESVTSRRR